MRLNLKPNQKCHAISLSEIPPLNHMTLVHFLSGYLLAVFFSQMTLLYMLILHIAFEFWESSMWGIGFFKLRFFTWLRDLSKRVIGMDLWCDYVGDSLINSTCDTIAGVGGFAYARSSFSLASFLYASF